MAEPVLLERPGRGVALLSLNRPASLNSMTLELVRELGARLEELATDREARAVVLTGAGRGFSSGHDFDELGEFGRAGQTMDEQLGEQSAYTELIVRMAELPQPLIAAVNGAAAGGGLCMAAAADTRICTPSARFNAAFVRLGISGCDGGLSYLLPRIVSPTVAFEMMLTGRLLEAEEAQRVGLVLRVVPEGELVEAALAIARAIADRDPELVRETKRMLRAGRDLRGLRQAIGAGPRSDGPGLRRGRDGRGAASSAGRAAAPRRGEPAILRR